MAGFEDFVAPADRQYASLGLPAGGTALPATKAAPYQPVAHPQLRSSSGQRALPTRGGDRKSTRLNSSHVRISYAVFCLKKKKQERRGAGGGVTARWGGGGGG